MLVGLYLKKQRKKKEKSAGALFRLLGTYWFSVWDASWLLHSFAPLLGRGCFVAFSFTSVCFVSAFVFCCDCLHHVFLCDVDLQVCYGKLLQFAKGSQYCSEKFPTSGTAKPKIRLCTQHILCVVMSMLLWRILKTELEASKELCMLIRDITMHGMVLSLIHIWRCRRRG